MKLSQSGIKSLFHPYGGGRQCPRLWLETNINGMETATSDAMMDGLIFEHELLGATARNGEIPTRGEKKGGGFYKVESDVRGLAQKTAKEVFPHYGIEILDTQIKLSTDDKKGTLDALMTIDGKRALLDVKFTNFADDEYSIWDFTSDNKTWKQAKNYQDAIRQSTHYVLMWHEVHGEYLPFYFLVVGKSGWVKLIKFQLTSNGVDAHEREIRAARELIAEYEQDGWQETGDYKTCHKCPVQDCKSRVIFPHVETYKV